MNAAGDLPQAELPEGPRAGPAEAWALRLLGEIASHHDRPDEPTVCNSASDPDHRSGLPPEGLPEPLRRPAAARYTPPTAGTGPGATPAPAGAAENLLADSSDASRATLAMAGGVRDRVWI